MKRLTITPEIQAMIDASAKTHVDPSKIVAFEAIAVDTKPLRKAGSIYNGAQLSPDMLQQMANYVNAGGDVPLHTLHMQGQELPVGKIFHASVETSGDTSDLVVMFYVPTNEAKLVDNLDTNIIHSVSVGVKSKQALCSQCGFDYFGSDADLMNFIDQACPDGHVIGEDDTALKLVGLDRWMELSLVSVGASPRAKIRSRMMASANDDDLKQMAAGGVPLNASLFISDPRSGKKKETKMDFSELITKLEAKTAEITTLTASVTSLQAQVQTLLQATATNWKVGASSDLEIEAGDAAWDGAEAKKQIFDFAGGEKFNPDEAKKGFLVFNAEKPNDRGSYKLPIARVKDGKLVVPKSGIRAAASRLPDADIPDDVRKSAQSVLDHYKQKADMKAATSEEHVAELQAQLDGVTASNTEYLTFLTEQAKRALIATGKPTDNLPVDVKGLIACIDEAKVNLVNLFPEGGRAAASTSVKREGVRATAYDAFRQPERH